MPESTNSDTTSVTGLEIRASLTGKLNLADYQNAVPVLRELSVLNNSATSHRSLTVSVSTDPCFVKPKRWHIDAIEAGQTCHVSNLDLQLDSPLLARLSEAETARVRFELTDNSAVAGPVAIWEKDVELLPRNHWGGLAHPPEMVAAFVQPNDPAVDRLLKKAAQFLRDNNRDPALNGYASGAKHAWEIISAIWAAVAGEKLDYSLPPASFEQTGQKVRSPGQIIESGLCTCLDLSLLFAAAAEQAGLHPLIIFTTGHAFAGCWLRAEEFGTAVVDDVTALRKRLLLRELTVFETTAAAGPSIPPFSRACELAEKVLSEDSTMRFEGAVDIRRARMRKIRPLASAEAAAPARLEQNEPGAEPVLTMEETPDLPDDPVDAGLETDPHALTPDGRITRWQRKLLDLSLRNNLLNFRKSKRAVVFEAPDPGRLEDILASGKALKLKPRPGLMEGADPRDRTLHEARVNEDVLRQHALDGLDRYEVFATAGERELDTTLVELFRSARTAMEEGGANTLYLALGFLVWTETAKPLERRKAPLILVPVALNRRSVGASFTLTLHGDEPQFNPTLVEMLRQDFELHIGIPEGDLPKDDSGLDVRGIWNRVAEAIKERKGWEVIPDVVLSTFSFAKHLMWKDLVDRTDQLKENPVVRHLIDTPREPFRGGAEFVDPKSLDRECHPLHTFCPLPADSSQLAAIMSADRGKNFVLVGPPGTGKSQTIANLVAHCIASGKRVLFVAEKIAALDVVYRRLQKEGLGQFCLEIHSSKAKKTDVLGALGSAWTNRQSRRADDWASEAAHLKSLRDRLNLYVERLHREHSNGLSVFRAFGHATAGPAIPRIDLPWPDASDHTPALLEEYRETIASLEIYAGAFGVAELQTTPLRPIAQTEWSPLWQTAFLRSTREAVAATDRVLAAAHALSELTGLAAGAALTPPRQTALAELAAALPGCAGRNWIFVTRPEAAQVVPEMRAATALVQEHRALSATLKTPWPAPVVESCRQGLQLLHQRAALRAALPAPWPPGITKELERGVAWVGSLAESERRLGFSCRTGVPQAARLEAEWRSAETSFWPFSTLKKRRIRASLAAIHPSAALDPAQTLPVLAHADKTASELRAIDLRALPPEVWAGTETSSGAAEAALRLQAALGAVASGAPWHTEGLDLIQSGLCGASLRETLGSLRRLAEAESGLHALEWLADATDGCWQGVGTEPRTLAAATDFVESWRAGEAPGEHPDVAAGRCGPHLQTQYQLLRRRSALEAQLERHAALGAATGGLWKGLATDVDEVGRAAEFYDVLSRTLPVIAASGETEELTRSAVERVTRNASMADPLRPVAEELRKAVDELPASLEKCMQTGAFLETARTEFRAMPAEALTRDLAAILDRGARLNVWCSWVQARDRARAAGLSAFAGAVEEGRIPPKDLRKAFDVNYSNWWLDHAVSGDDVLRTFIPAEHEQRIAEFQALEDRYAQLTRDWIRAKLSAATPGMDSPALGPEWGLLRHELTKKRRHLPLRDLMERIPSAITNLTPCLLMSPLSIAQYLAVSAATFDVVVFDEASQITVWDAIGAFARAKQVVMVGDPKQLPPTNFFGRTDTDEELPEDVPDDMESILDECIGASLPAIQLNWHYRSRHESLIAFSNRRFYGNKLVTFPSPVTDDRAVTYHYVEGVYEKGTARTNPQEAQAVVRDIVGLLKSKRFTQTGHSIGVVTFNAEQQRLIEDLLDAERRADVSIEAHFGDDRLEPVFVKNLESVQGDERDIMYFSTTYGPDITGRLSMNFGPMNRDGGERRLNVAITRARQELRVFSSLRPEQIDLSRTQASGVAELKLFLEYAGRGPRAFAEQTAARSQEYESPFEEQVASALRTRGWTIQTQVGVSAFRIDLGVVDPDEPGRFLAGVECDGATYHRSATARDRDKLRQQVLLGLGWKLVRIWSTDWWINPEAALQRVDAQLRSLLDEHRRTRPTPAPDGTRSTAAAPANPREEASRIDTPEGGEVDAAGFFDRSYDRKLIDILAGIVDHDGPILDEALARRVARLHGWQRTGVRILDRVVTAARSAFPTTREDVGTYFWPRNIQTGDLIPFRHGTARAVDEICLQELATLATDPLRAGKTGDDVIAIITRTLGLQRTGAASRLRMAAAIAIAEESLRK